MQKQVVITGIGAISPLGFGREEFWRNISQGRSGISPLTGFDLPSLNMKLGGEIQGFQPETYLGNTGHRYVQRGTKILASTVKLAIQDAGLQPDEDFSGTTGLMVGTAYGNFIQTTQYTQRIMTGDPKELLPMDGFDAALNSAINYATVHYRLKACVRTFSSGIASSLDAIHDAAHLIRTGTAERFLAGGFEQLSPDNYQIYSIREELASGFDGMPARSMPFDRRRNGFVPGEGCWLFLLEELELAQRRNATIYGEIAGYSSLFIGNRTFDVPRKVHIIKRTMEQALQEAALAKGAIELVCAGANSSPIHDLVEGTAYKEFIGDTAPITAPKSMLGESLGASGSMQVATALMSLNQGLIPPTLNYEQPDEGIGLESIATSVQERGVRTVLVNSFDLSANCSSLVIKKSF